ncbi:Rieske 2Fe-2S domain-containing protein [Nannocystis sp. ILAH1]|uniref:Rieske (2Fe-2S) protein n=1 Tax=unclassified Nannocystis TaxID=2627009 RepID=UPI00226FF256|nr:MULTISPECIES: Rieske 2Fe-2S domain-containing protein [unclassified Nannocystis]MCY0994766.1 Rieske 2Fe-2S domain-containing protein [Nannocystis sp. ILAH1]MCY1065367.1 Rieske 2Fe-2S domain-containing protein [Nannocystis sp. RBIL2]
MSAREVGRDARTTSSHEVSVRAGDYRVRRETASRVGVVQASRKGPFFHSGTRLFLLRCGGGLRVVPDACKHRGGPLSLGVSDERGTGIVCPWHGYTQCMRRLADTALPTVRVGERVFFVLPAQPSAARQPSPASSDPAPGAP